MRISLRKRDEVVCVIGLGHRGHAPGRGHPGGKPCSYIKISLREGVGRLQPPASGTAGMDRAEGVLGTMPSFYMLISFNYYQL